ncbi:phosphoadenylyl-sulfate reductase [Telmatocola sphagniphila]|jgi:phosphoadenosine phosphosulfate reductase|uniref:Adenosine 5'-phosphosulfate reductase n=1 Tax=Telmatocola sphagniphila TaxID=1123043 RepID=A0A8E6B4M3_9BACT|nr:phosphoadenylyl-sulfate reductase [Telmatocola sphagniphila]QVL31247.1 phosphoadenylyl-sulfate reductase [Telmatocola sphagniphila]
MDSPFITAAEIESANLELTGRSAEEVLRWAVGRFGHKLMMATAFGAEGCCLIHMLAQIDPTIRVINLDTGYQFKETLKLRERLLYTYGVAVEFIRPDTTVEEYERMHGGPLYEHRSDQCCFDRKIVPLRKAVVGYQAWISSIRKDQTADRARADVVQWDPKFGVVKVNPILTWNYKDVWNFIYKNNVPYNPLHDQGYPSIGCWPCTQPVTEGADERSGRWAGMKKKECGLHVVEYQQGSGI